MSEAQVRSVARWGLFCGMLGPALWAVTIVVGGEFHPGFSHLHHYISELGESGSITELPMRVAGFVLPGLLHLAFAAAVWRLRPGGLAWIGALLIALDGAGRIGAGIFPCDMGCEPAVPSASQLLHSAFARLGFLSMVAAAIVWGMVQYRQRAMAAYSVLSGLAGFGFLVMVTRSARGEWVGLWESLATGVLSLWLFVFAWMQRRVAIAAVG